MRTVRERELVFGGHPAISLLVELKGVIY